MPRLLKTIIRWTILQLVRGPVFSWLSAAIQLRLSPWTSWAVYALAGREAARHGKFWHAGVAAVTIHLIEHLLWRLGGMPHVTRDLPWQTDAMVSVFIMLVAGAWGLVGGFFGWIARGRENDRHVVSQAMPDA